MTRPRTWRRVGAVLALTSIAVACSSESDGSVGSADFVVTAPPDVTDAEREAPITEPDIDVETTDPESEPEPPVTEADVEVETIEPEPVVDVVARAGTVDPTLTRDDVDCSEEGLGSTAEASFTVAHLVVDGALGAVCLGEEDARLVDSWRALSTITPSLQLTDLALFGGFVSAESGEEVTLAFVNALDDDGTEFQMSVNLDEYDQDGNEALLTMAHEFSHVFTSLPMQIDRSAEAFDSCDTYFNGEGCYEPDSLMFQWIERFWGNGLIDQIDPYAEASGDEGQERCDVEPGFFGAYAASNPEEDFAESFSALVFQLEPTTDQQLDKLAWMAAQPGLVEFRDRAVAAGVGPLENNFDPCGEAA